MHQTIDWFSWLSKTGLEPSLIYEYGMAFSHNELEEDDIAYFNHEFLQSMGVSIAKHRLEILKLARKHKGSSGSHPMSKIFLAIKKTKRHLANYVRTWVHRDDSALVLVQTSYGSRWKGAMLKRNKRSSVTFKPNGTTTLLLTNGYKPGGVRVNNFSSPVVNDQEKTDSGDGGGDDHHANDDDDDGYWSRSGVEGIKWDTMFQNMKPT